MLKCTFFLELAGGGELRTRGLRQLRLGLGVLLSEEARGGREEDEEKEDSVPGEGIGSSFCSLIACECTKSKLIE